MLFDYLHASSIHGLRYLAESKNHLFRLVWFICIAGSFTTAVYIIYLNVRNWENSPAVITKAQPVLVKVRQSAWGVRTNEKLRIVIRLFSFSSKTTEIPTLTITICPRKPDFRYLVTNYFNKYVRINFVSSSVFIEHPRSRTARL